MTQKVCLLVVGGEVIGWEHDVFFWLQLCWSSADVSCHVVAALPVPLGQCDCHPAVSGHVLRHHPAASRDAAWTNHHPHDRWVLRSFVSCSGCPRLLRSIRNEKQMFSFCTLACWVWLIMCLMRLSPSLDKLTTLCGFYFHMHIFIK